MRWRKGLAVAEIEIGDTARSTVDGTRRQFQEQIDFLRTQGCAQIQGYWLSKPLDADALTAFVQQRRQFV